MDAGHWDGGLHRRLWENWKIVRREREGMEVEGQAQYGVIICVLQTQFSSAKKNFICHCTIGGLHSVPKSQINQSQILKYSVSKQTTNLRLQN